MKVECNELVEVFHQSGCFVDWHTHNHNELVYCLEGKGSVNINGKRSEFSTGNYYITHKGTTHIEKDDSTTRIIYFYFEAPKDYVVEGAYTDFDGSVLSAVKKLQREYKKAFPFKEEMLESIILQILIETKRYSDHNKTQLQFSDIVQYIDENLEQEIDFRALATKHRYGYERFRHLFKEFSGQSPHQYVIAQRIEKAKFLMTLNPKTSVTEIAFSCGFSSSSQFSNIFLAKVGVTPSKFRKQNS